MSSDDQNSRKHQNQNKKQFYQEEEQQIKDNIKNQANIDLNRDSQCQQTQKKIISQNKMTKNENLEKFKEILLKHAEYNCLFCREFFQNAQQTLIHIRKQHKNYSQRFKDNFIIRKCMKLNRNKKQNKKFQCICGKIFNWCRNLQRHIYLKHSPQAFQQFKQAWLNLKINYFNQPQGQKFICYCGKYFYNATTAYYHLYNDHKFHRLNMKQQQFLSLIRLKWNDQAYIQKNRHLQSQQRQKISILYRKMTKKQRLSQFQRMLLKNIEYKCLLCHLIFQKAQQILNHLRKQHKNYSQSFSDNFLIKKCMKLPNDKLKIKKLQCICRKEYGSYQGLQKHLRLSHSPQIVKQLQQARQNLKYHFLNQSSVQKLILVQNQSKNQIYGNQCLNVQSYDHFQQQLSNTQQKTDKFQDYQSQFQQSQWQQKYNFSNQSQDQKLNCPCGQIFQNSETAYTHLINEHALNRLDINQRNFFQLIRLKKRYLYPIKNYKNNKKYIRKSYRNYQQELKIQQSEIYDYSSVEMVQIVQKDSFYNKINNCQDKKQTQKSLIQILNQKQLYGDQNENCSITQSNQQYSQSNENKDMKNYLKIN